MSTLLHHPFPELHHLHEVEQEGESAATPLLAIASLALFLFSLMLLMIGLAYGLAYLVTGAFL
jgi:hypothetical protein